MNCRQPSSHHKTKNVELVQRSDREVRVERRRRPPLRRLSASNVRIQPATASIGRAMFAALVARRCQMRRGERLSTFSVALEEVPTMQKYTSKIIYCPAHAPSLSTALRDFWMTFKL